MTFVIWMTGLPCSGKTSISRVLCNYISNLAILDGDELRQWLSPNDFSTGSIILHNKKVAHLAKLLLTHKIPVCVSLVSPFSKNREDARKIIDSNNFIELYVKCERSVCEQRDVKGLYKKARAGLLKDFLGIDNRYEIPKNPDLIIDTENYSIEQNVQKIVNHLKTKISE